jgi:predicted transcriptional regulator
VLSVCQTPELHAYHALIGEVRPAVPAVPHLKRLREGRFLTQEELAERSGVSRPTIARLESSGDDARLKTIRKLAEALGVEPTELTGAR